MIYCIKRIIFSFEILVGFHRAIVFGRPENVVRVLETGWNIKKFCDPSLTK